MPLASLTQDHLNALGTVMAENGRQSRGSQVVDPVGGSWFAPGEVRWLKSFLSFWTRRFCG